MKFEVTYRDKSGVMSQMEIEVKDRNAVYTDLRRQGITPLSLREIDEKKAKMSHGKFSIFRIVKYIVFLIAVAIAAGTAWYIFMADSNQRMKVTNFAREIKAGKITMTTDAPPPEKPRGSGKITIKGASEE